MVQPKILLLDEPTSALDAGRASYLIEILTELATNSQTTILMVNHQLELAQQFCTRVLYLQESELILDAPNSSQLDWQKLRDLLQAQVSATDEWMELTQE